MSEGRKNEPATATSDAADDEPWVSLNAATTLLDMHRETILKLVIKGTLTADTRGPLTFISRESIERYLTAVASPK